MAVTSQKYHQYAPFHSYSYIINLVVCPFYTAHKTLTLTQVRLLARAEKADAVEDQAGLLPVHVAASAGQAPMVAYLAARAGVEVPNRQGLSPLMCAAYRFWFAGLN